MKRGFAIIFVVAMITVVAVALEDETEIQKVRANY